MDDSTIEALRKVLQDMTLTIDLISSGERSGEALINFIEEMLKTIEAWCTKYNVIFDEGVMATESEQISHPKPSPNSGLTKNHNYPATNASEATDSLERPLDLDQQLEVVKERQGHNQTQRETHHQSVESSNQDGGGNKNKEVEHLVHPQNDENEINESKGADICKVKPLKRVSRKTRSQVALTSTDGGPMHVDGNSTHDGEAKLNSLEPLAESSKLADATWPSHVFESKGDVIKSPSWLPKGWITEMKTRGTAEMKTRGTSGSAGSKDKYYFDPTSQRGFRSKKEVLAFLGATKRKRGRPKKAAYSGELAQTTGESPRHTYNADEAECIQEPVMSLNPELEAPSNSSALNDTTPATSSTNATSIEAVNSIMPTLDTTKRKRGRPRKNDSLKNLSQITDQSPGQTSAAAQARRVPEAGKSSTTEMQVPFNRSSHNTDVPPPVSVSVTVAPLGSMNSCVSMPHQLGQTSEWLVYESLASLPFPMLEHLRLVESNANKLANHNSPPTLWPWMLGNAEGLKKPFLDTKADESKLVEEKMQDQNALISRTGETQAPEVLTKQPKKAARTNAI